MKDIIPAKKQSPILGLTGMGGGVGSNLGGSLAEKTYIDEVFNVKTYRGNATERTITTGIDLAGEGGLLWFKNRENNNQANYLNDTTSPPQTSSPWYSYPIFSDSSGTRGASANGLKSFNSDGFTIQTDTHCNGNNNKQLALSFRKAPGFFDIVTWTGNGVDGRDIPHNLESVPGCIMIKRLSAAENWAVYHRSIGNTEGLTLDTDAYNSYSKTWWDETTPTATTFRIDNAARVNSNGETYLAYVFAGGASDDPGSARSVDFDGSGDYLTTDQSTNYAMGTGDFTVEGWFKKSSKNNFGYFMNNTNGLSGNYGVSVHYYHTYGLAFYASGAMQQTNFHPPDGQWFHIALVRNSGTTTLYYNGVFLKSAADTTDYTDANCQRFVIGGYDGTGYLMNGSVSNFRAVKGTAVYTSSFRPPTQGLTNITNTKLLCCNKNTVTGTTTGAVTSSGDPTSSIDTPFDDPEGFKFGKGGDQSIIKTGSYTGNGASLGPEINLGFEPQWVLVKRTDATANWLMWDSMRGIVTGGTQSDPMLFPDLESAESTSIYRMDLTSRGFKITSSNGAINANGGTYVYMAIRRPDPLVGKPAVVGTDVFAIDNDLNTNPDFRSTFPVDFAFLKRTTSASSWWQSARLMQGSRMYLNEQTAEATGQSWTNFDWGDPDGWSTGNFTSDDYSWMFKRHAGFDVVTYLGNGVMQASGGQHIPHNLDAVPQMMWVKSRTQGSSYWGVYHFGENGGTNPETYRLDLHDTGVETGSSFWNSTAPTSESFSVGNTWTNTSNEQYIAMLFASVTGISKCGYYDGQNSDLTITTGFQPRFLIIKRANSNGGWYLADTTRGWGAGNDQLLQIEDTAGQYGNTDFGAPTSTGFTVKGSQAGYNASGGKYIYYAHA